jgi:alpha-ketoglutarate-dependent taurine dioxygenase
MNLRRVINYITLYSINVRENRRGDQNGQSRETGNLGYTRRRKTMQKHNAICFGHPYSQANINNVKKT